MNTARELSEALAALLRHEHDALAEFLVALADFDHRRTWVELGHSSLFYYLHRELHLTKGAAQYRKVAAELIQQVPGVVEPLRDGRLCLTSIIEAAKVVTADNWETVLPQFYGLSKREAMEIVAGLQPHPAPPERTVVTPVRLAPALSGAAPALPALEPREASSLPETETPSLCASSVTCSGATAGAAGWPANQPPPSAPSVAVTRPLDVVPLTAEQSRIHLTVSKAFMKKLEAAQDAMCHAMPGATPAEILDAGLDLLLAKTARRKGLVERPQKNPRPMKGDGIPAHVKREVWKRDGGRCQWKLASGGICGSTRNLELDHIQPRSKGGTSTADNLRVACRRHNNLAARLVLGDDLMDQYSSGLRGSARRPSRGRPAATAPAPTTSPP